MSLESRVGKLERRPGHRCCPPHALMLYDPATGDTPPVPACERCGQTPQVLVYLPANDRPPVDDPRVSAVLG
jgi:hypothetical protein